MREIIIATGTLGGGGAERVFLNLANEFANNGRNVRVLVTGSRPAESYPLSEKVIVEKILSNKDNKLLKIFDKMSQFRKYFKKHREAIVISFFTDVSAYCVLTSFGLGIKNVVSERNDPNKIPQKRRMRILRNFTFGLAEACVFQTEDAKKYFSGKIQRKGHVIFNPINTATLPDPIAISQRKKIVIAVGRIVPQKNFLMLLKAWNKIKEKYFDYELHIYGDKTYGNGLFTTELEQYIDSHHLRQSVKLKGFSNDIYTAMNEAMLYVSSSDFEGMSNTMLEAMAIGTPTIATDCPIGGARAIISNMENGILTTVGNADELSNAIVQVLDDDRLKEKLSCNGQKLRESMSIQKTADRWMELIDGL